MIEFPITLTSGGSVCLPGHASALALGYTQKQGRLPPARRCNRRMGRADHPGILAPAGRRGTGVHAGEGRLCGRACQRDRPTRQWLHHL